MKSSTGIHAIWFAALASAATSFYPITADLYAYGDYFIRRSSNTSSPYIIGDSSVGTAVTFTINDDGTIQDSDGYYLYFTSSEHGPEYIYPTKNITNFNGWSIDSSNFLAYNSGSFSACPIDDHSAYFAYGTSNCGVNDASVPVTLNVDASVTVEAFNAAPKFTLWADGDNLGDGFLRTNVLSPWALTIGGDEGDIAEFVLLPNHKVYDQNDYLSINTLVDGAQVVGEIERYLGVVEVSAISNFVISDNELVVSTQPDDLADGTLTTDWYVCANGTRNQLSYNGLCGPDNNGDVTGQVINLYLNHTSTTNVTSGGNGASSISSSISSSSSFSNGTSTETGSSATSISTSATASTSGSESTLTSGAASSEVTNGSATAGISTSTATASDESTTVVTITSCSSHVCSETAVTTGVTVITTTSSGVITEYTTYCPLTGESIAASESTVAVTTVAKESTAAKSNEAVTTAAVTTAAPESNSYTTVEVESTITASRSSGVVTEGSAVISVYEGAAAAYGVTGPLLAIALLFI